MASPTDTVSKGFDALDAREADLALEIRQAQSQGRAIRPFTDRGVPLDLATAYRIAAALAALRGSPVVGRKIGFTNRAIWPRYGVDGPIVGNVFADTRVDGADGGAVVALAGLVEPRIEPEIVLGIAEPPSPGMDEAALAACVAFVAPAFEIVDSIYPGWRFEAADAIAAGSLHARLVVGERLPMTADLVDLLPRLEVVLSRDGTEIERGSGANVLGGPLSALRHLVEATAREPALTPIAAGDVVSTGTLTDAWPVAPGERWIMTVSGLPLAPLALRFD